MDNNIFLFIFIVCRISPADGTSMWQVI